jgi:sensor histidine kinase YesM
MIYGALGGGLALRAYFSEQHRLTASHHKRELAAMRLQKDETALRLGVLQAQVEPHFLFNTLASLRSLVRQDPALAETTIDALVDHLRATIPKMRDDTGKLASTLGQQLDICSSYLKLMQVRMGSRLSYEINVPTHFREYEFPPLMLISLVENAIKHGIETKPGEGSIQIHAEKIVTSAGEGKLKVSVLDNGPGLSAGLGGGLGLANIREQLKARFANAAKLDIGTHSTGGTIASVELPLSVNKDNA